MTSARAAQIPPPPARADQGLAHRPDVEALRAVAILLVVAAHAGLPGFAGGFIGVDVFFVLSGFLMTRLIAHEYDRRGRFDYWNFYARRLRRLLPLLLLVLLATGLGAILLLAPFEQFGQAQAAHLVAWWLSNFHFVALDFDYFGPGSERNLFLHTWSLGVEEQFYLVWPAFLIFLLWAAQRVTAANGRSGAAVALLATALIGFWFALELMQSAPKSAFYMMHARFWQFCCGGLVALTASNAGASGASSPDRPARWRHAAIYLGLALVLFAAMYLGPEVAYPGYWALLPTLGTAMILHACSGIAAAGQPGLLTHAWSQWLGRHSYGWYLWHWPVLLLGLSLPWSAGVFTAPLLGLLALLLAWGSYRWLENPVRHHRWLLARPRITVAASLLLMATAWGLAQEWGRALEVWRVSDSQARWLRIRDEVSPVYAEGCDDWYRSAEVKPCFRGSESAPRSIVLWGDSVGTQWFSALEPITASGEWRLTVLTKSACPIVDGELFYARIGRRYHECEAWRAGVVEWLRRHPPDLLVMGSGASNALELERWRDGTRSLLQRVTPPAGRVVILAPTPVLAVEPTACLARYFWRPQWLRREGECDQRLSLMRHREVADALRQASSGLATVSVLDLEAAVCPGGYCPAVANQLVVYRDRQHLTNGFVRSLSPRLLGGLAIEGVPPARR